ncbi:MAG: hypothetical protein U5K00_02445 [Melioribacteraceae bacterium]|nr:hypothetical protein [Melioribacteraceae bacterium]
MKKFIIIIIIIFVNSFGQTIDKQDSVYLPLSEIDNLVELRQELDEAFNDLNLQMQFGVFQFNHFKTAKHFTN